MPTTNTITSAVYRLLAADTELAAACTVYKGAKRPADAGSPAITVQVKRLEPGEGIGIWMCDIVITIHVATLTNRMTDQDTHDTLCRRIQAVLDDVELDLTTGHAHPLIAGTVGDPEWRSRHDQETAQELTFGLIFLDFGAEAG